MNHIRFKRRGGVDPYDYDKAWVAELRSYLPKSFKKVSDEELARAYSEWSENNFCASWMSTDRETAVHFAADVEFTGNEYGAWSLVLAFLAGSGLTFVVGSILTAIVHK